MNLSKGIGPSARISSMMRCFRSTVVALAQCPESSPSLKPAQFSRHPPAELIDAYCRTGSSILRLAGTMTSTSPARIRATAEATRTTIADSV